MAHGAGGKATAALVEGLLAPALSGLEALGDAGDRRRRRRLRHDRRFVVKPLRFPGGSIGELAVNGTVNDLAMAGARPLALTLSPDPRGGPRRRRRCAPRSTRSRARPRRRACGSSAATRRSSSAATPTACTSTPPASAARDPRAALRRRRCARATGSCSPARSARTARRSCSPAASSSSTPTIVSDTRSLWPAVDALLEPPGRPALPARRHPRRRRVGAQRARPRVGRGDARPARRRCRSRPAVAGACELLGIDPMYVANEGMLVAFVAPESPTPRSPRCARSRA